MDRKDALVLALRLLRQHQMKARASLVRMARPRSRSWTPERSARGRARVDEYAQAIEVLSAMLGELVG